MLSHVAFINPNVDVLFATIPKLLVATQLLLQLVPEHVVCNTDPVLGVSASCLEVKTAPYTIKGTKIVPNKILSSVFILVIVSD